tara:strand:- start:48 stop:302 length:255 start_codon:yes stop_codon:yes gene_type:complete
MADNSFGIKTLNLVGLGTPKIESLGNLNLNAVNVAISTNATVGGTINVTGGFTSGTGTPAQISVVGSTLTFTVVGIGSTSLTLS